MTLLQTQDEMEVTKENIHKLKDGDILHGKRLDGKVVSHIITITYQISDIEAKICKVDKTQHYFKSLTKDGKPDMRTKSVDVLDSALTWFKK